MPLLRLLLLLSVIFLTRLLATVEGRPLPTELPKRPPPSSSGGGKYGGGFGNDSGGGGTDQRSMERLPGETDSEYVARQTALKGEASARMRDKFGGSNRMQGLGSDSSYNPASGGYGGGGGGGGLNADEIGGQIGVIGQKSMRFLSDSFATLQTGVKVRRRGKRKKGDNMTNKRAAALFYGRPSFVCSGEKSESVDLQERSGSETSNSLSANTASSLMLPQLSLPEMHPELLRGALPLNLECNVVARLNTMFVCRLLGFRFVCAWSGPRRRPRTRSKSSRLASR